MKAEKQEKQEKAGKQERKVRKLGWYIRSGIRTLVIVQLVSVVMYILYRQLNIQRSTAERTLFGLFIFINAFNILFSILMIKVSYLASVFLDMLCATSLVNFVGSVIEVLRTFDPSLSMSPETIVVVYTFLILNITYFVLVFFIRFSVDWSVWEGYLRMSDEGYYDLWDRYVDASTPKKIILDDNMLVSTAGRNVDAFKNASIVGIAVTLIPVEVSLLYFYVLFMTSLEPDSASGWFFCLHIFTIIASLSWLLASGTKRHIRSLYDWWYKMLLLVMAFDLMQMVFVGQSDYAILIGIRALLFIVAVVYLVTISYGLYEENRDADVSFIKISRSMLMFYFYQFVVPTLALSELTFEGLYFAYVTAMHLQNPVWSNIVHVLSPVVGFLVALSSRDTLEYMRILVGVATLVMIYDTIIIGTLSMSMHVFTTEYVIQGFFLFFDVSYAVAFAFTWVGATDDDEEKYYAMVVRDKITAGDILRGMRPLGIENSNNEQDLRNVSDYAYEQYEDKQGQKTNEELSALFVEEQTSRAQGNAEKIYYMVSVCMRVIFNIEAVNFAYWAMIMADGTYRWYEWFYIVHVFTILTMIITLTFTMNTKVCLVFVMAFAVLDFATDVSLISVLSVENSLNDGKMAIRALFIAMDVFYMLFAGLILGTAKPVDYEMLMFMDKLETRLKKGAPPL